MICIFIALLLHVVTSQFYIKFDLAYHIRFREVSQMAKSYTMSDSQQKKPNKYIKINEQKYILEDIIDKPKYKSYVFFYPQHHIFVS